MMPSNSTLKPSPGRKPSLNLSNASTLTTLEKSVNSALQSLTEKERGLLKQAMPTLETICSLLRTKYLIRLAGSATLEDREKLWIQQSLIDRILYEINSILG